MSDANIDSLLAMSLDDLPDLPEFKVYPAGAHRVTMKFEKKQIGTHPAVEAKFTMIATEELTDPAKDQPVDAGTESSVAYMLDNEFGLGNLKDLLKPLAEHFGIVTNEKGATLAVIAATNEANLEVVIVTKTRQNKEKTQTYLEITQLIVI